MSENQPARQESNNLIDRHEVKGLPTAAQAEKLRIGESEQLQILAEQQQDAERARSILQSQEELSSAAEALQEANEPQAIQQHTFMDRALELHALRSQLRNIQYRESASARAFSKVIHQPAVRAVSEVAGKTVSRPSGLLGGSILAFVGTSGYFYYATHLGFTYNYFVFLLLFAVGFAIGLVLELVIWAISGRRASA